MLTLLLPQAVTELPFPPEQPQVFSDLVFAVKGYHFHCHKASCQKKLVYTVCLLYMEITLITTYFQVDEHPDGKFS